MSNHVDWEGVSFNDVPQDRLLQVTRDSKSSIWLDPISRDVYKRFDGRYDVRWYVVVFLDKER